MFSRWNTGITPSNIRLHKQDKLGGLWSNVTLKRISWQWWDSNPRLQREALIQRLRPLDHTTTWKEIRDQSEQASRQTGQACRETDKWKDRQTDKQILPPVFPCSVNVSWWSLSLPLFHIYFWNLSPHWRDIPTPPKKCGNLSFSVELIITVKAPTIYFSFSSGWWWFWCVSLTSAQVHSHSCFN